MLIFVLGDKTAVCSGSFVFQPIGDLAEHDVAAGLVCDPVPVAGKMQRLGVRMNLFQSRRDGGTDDAISPGADDEKGCIDLLGIDFAGLRFVEKPENGLEETTPRFRQERGMNLARDREWDAVEETEAGDEKGRTVRAFPEKRLRQHIDRGEDGGGIDMVHSSWTGGIEQNEPANGTTRRHHLGDESAQGMAH